MRRVEGVNYFVAVSTNAERVKLARACSLEDWSFAEWLHGRTYEPRGMRGQSWNAAAFLIASCAVADGTPIFNAD